jgi:uncharacterized protein DUF1835
VTTLHITNGDCAAGTLRQFLTDPVSITCDVLHDGPAPRVDLDTWHELRAKFLSGFDHASFEATRDSLAQWDRDVAAADRYEEIVLWFEHDLFDQLLLIRTLDLIGDRESAAAGRSTTDRHTPARVSLICIDRFPGVDRFIGLGQLTAGQLASLVGTRRPVTAEQYAIAATGWDAFRAPDPSALLELVRLKADMMRPLPFLRDALKRLLEEYPSTANGLSRTADAALRELDAPRSGLELFVATQAREERPFMGDWSFFDILRQLAEARVPLVTIAPPGAGEHVPANPAQDLRAHTIAITDAGRDVLAGRKDAVALNGIDVWRGGVHLVASDDERSPWRWDAGRETLV